MYYNFVSMKLIGKEIFPMLCFSPEYNMHLFSEAPFWLYLLVRKLTMKGSEIISNPSLSLLPQRTSSIYVPASKP